jgi:hypothetical protein
VRDGLTFVAPYDDPHTIAGQGTIGDEILRQVCCAVCVWPRVGGVCVCGRADRPAVPWPCLARARGPPASAARASLSSLAPPSPRVMLHCARPLAAQIKDPSKLDAIFVAIGGGGLVAGIAAYVKALYPHIQVAAGWCAPLRARLFMGCSLAASPLRCQPPVFAHDARAPPPAPRAMNAHPNRSSAWSRAAPTRWPCRWRRAGAPRCRAGRGCQTATPPRRCRRGGGGGGGLLLCSARCMP